MTKFDRKVMRGGDLVMNSCAGTLSTTKAWLILTCLTRLIGWDIDGEYIKVATRTLVSAFAKQGLNLDSDIQVSDD